MNFARPNCMIIGMLLSLTSCSMRAMEEEAPLPKNKTWKVRPELNPKLVSFCEGRSLQPARDLLQKGADVNACNHSEMTCLHFACANEDYSLVNLLIKEGASLESQTDQGFTPLYCAAKTGSIEVCELLIENGALLNAQSKQGWTALHIAAVEGHVGVCELLIEKKASLEARADQGFTSLHIAADKGCAEVCELLIEKGALLEAQTNLGWRALHLAAEEGHVEVCELLIAKGALLESQINRDVILKKYHFGGLTPLHLAGFYGKQDMVVVLLKHNAAIHAKTQDGRTVLEIARQREHKDLVVYLESYLHDNLDVLAATVEESNGLLEVIKQGNANSVSNLLRTNRYTAEELKAALVKALELNNHEMVGLLISKGSIPLQSISFELGQEKVLVSE